MKLRRPSQLLCNCGGGGRNRVEHSGGASSCRSAEDVVGEGGDFEKHVDRGDERNQQNGKPADELERRDRANALEGEHTNNKVADDVNDRGGDHLVERILEKTAQPAPE